MKVTTREVKFRDPNGRMVSSLVIGNGSLHDEVADYLDNNPEPVATATGEWLTENITQPTTPVVDASLSVSGAAADSKKVGDELNDLKSQIAQLEAIPYTVKQAMDTLFSKMGVKDDDGYSSEYATIHAWATSINVTSISAVYTQSGTVHDYDTLDSLKTDLVVTANYDNGTSSVVPSSNYVLSGTLEEGNSVITLSYEGYTTTFTVTVTSKPTTYTWLYDPAEDGLLSAQNYISNPSIAGSETVTDGVLVLNNTLNTVNNFPLTDATSSEATLSCKALVIDCPLASAKSPAGFKLRVSNGTSGGVFSLQKTNGNKLSVAYYEANVWKKAETDIDVDSKYHTFEASLVNGHQIFKIDGQTVIDSATLSTSYTTTNSILQQATSNQVNPNGVTTWVKWIAFNEVS